MPKHIVRLIIILGFVVVAGFGAKLYFTPDSFGDFGYYRGDSVKEIASLPLMHQAPNSCQLCHWERHGEWSAGSHKTVNCQVCHGPAGDHPASGKLPIPTNTVALCSLCHEAMPARPAAQPQVNIVTHSAGLSCTTCHSPHSPSLGYQDVMEKPAGQEITEGDSP